MSARWKEPKKPKRAVEGSCRSIPESHFDTTIRDTVCFERALRDYQETSWDDSSFEELPFETQQTILRRAQEIKACQDRLKAVVDVQHPIAS